jgi:hypothetical protein
VIEPRLLLPSVFPISRPSISRRSQTSGRQ